MKIWIAGKNLMKLHCKKLLQAAREAFYSESNLEDITDKDYKHVEKVWEAFKIKNCGEYHDLYVQCDALLLADVFKNFRDKCIKTYGLDPDKKKSKTKVKQFICDIEDKEKYVIQIRALKKVLNHGLTLKRLHRAIQFNQKAWLNPYIDMNTRLRKEAKNEFEKDFFKVMNNSVFGKTMDNVRNQ